MNCNKNKLHNKKHLTFTDRMFIEQELFQGSNFTEIGTALAKDPSTISKEVKRNKDSFAQQRFRNPCYACMGMKECRIRGMCRDCKRACRMCYQKDATKICSYFIPYKECEAPLKPPYVCNSCKKFKNCSAPKAYYSARSAQKKYEKTLSDSRKGINLTEEELQDINELISPLVLKGQPLSHIFAVHAEDIPVCRRTLYNYLDLGVFKAKNIDLPRRVRYKKRRKSSKPRVRNYQQVYRNKRTYKDFEIFVEAHPDADVVEMDTVKGSRNAGKCLLTLLFRSCSFMLIILLPRCNQESVVHAINRLTDTIGLRVFRKYFPVILTDNGSEFKNPWDIEKTPDGKHRTYVFFCDPYISNQKGRLEKNHEYIRYVIPKGRSMQNYTQEDISLMASHINSTARDGLNGKTPFDLAELLLDKRIPASAGQFKVSPDDVSLKPALIEHKRISEKENPDA